MDELFSEIDLLEKELKELNNIKPGPLYMLYSGVVCVRAMRVVIAAREARNAIPDIKSNEENRIVTDG